MRGKGYGHQSYPGGPQGYLYQQAYHNRSGYPSPMHGGRRSLEGEGYPEDYGYQQTSDDSRDTQNSAGDMGQAHQTGFSGSFGEGSGLGESQHGETFSQEKSPNNEFATGDQVQSPPDIKYEATPLPFIKPDEFELIEIDPDEEEDI